MEAEKPRVHRTEWWEQLLSTWRDPRVVVRVL